MDGVAAASWRARGSMWHGSPVMPFGAIGLCRAVGLEWPAWLRASTSRRPLSGVSCLLADRRAVQQYRERRVITDPGRPLGPEPADRDLERRCRQWITRPVLGLLSNDGAPSGWASRRDPHGWGLGPVQDGTIVPRRAVGPERRRGAQRNSSGRGRPAPALNLARNATRHQGR